MKKKSIAVIVILTALAAAPVFADGGGGVFYGLQTSEYPFLKDYPIRNNSLGLAYYGGYGYGVNGRNISGGFGFAITDTSGESGIAGGFGGMINGIRLVRWPVTLSLISWTAVGGIAAAHEEGVDQPGGFLAVMEEITLELGIPINRWFMPTLYAGYQVAGNLLPGTPFDDFLLYTPVVGIRLAWGKFY